MGSGRSGEPLICQHSLGGGGGVRGEGEYGIQLEETFDKLLEVLSESLYHSYTKRHAPLSKNAERSFLLRSPPLLADF